VSNQVSWRGRMYRKDLKNNSDVLFQRIGYHIYTYKSVIIPHLLKGMSAHICSQI